MLFFVVVLSGLLSGGPPDVTAQPTLQVIVDRAEVSAGQRMTARVIAKDFPPFRTHGIRVGYDRKLLRCLSVQNTGFYEGYSTFFFRQIDSVGGKAGADEAILGPGWVNKDGSILEMQFEALGDGRVYLPFLQTSVYDSGLALVQPVLIDSLRELGALDAPRLLSPAQLQPNVPRDAEFIWSVVDGASAYRVQVYRDSAFSYGVALDTTVTDDRVAVRLRHFLARHFWRVRAEAPGITSSWSEVREFITEQRTFEAPKLLTPIEGALLDGDAPMAFTWESVDGATVYDFEIAEQPGGAQLAFREVNGATELIVTGLVLRQQTSYYWRVRGRSPEGIGPWSDNRSFQLRPAPPRAIVLLLPEDGAQIDPLGVRLSWERNPNADLYFVQVSTSADFATLTWESSVTSTEAMPQNLESATRYHWRVRGINGAGLGPWSGQRSFVTNAQTSVGAPVGAAIAPVISPPAPHPITDATAIRIDLPSGGGAVLDLIDLGGRHVSRLLDATMPAGGSIVRWSATDRDGHTLPAGVYMLRLVTTAGSAFRPVIVSAR